MSKKDRIEIDNMSVENYTIVEQTTGITEENTLLNKIVFRHPGQIVFGEGSFNQFVEDFTRLGFKKLYILAIPVLKDLLGKNMSKFEEAGISVEINFEIENEPSFEDFQKVLKQAKIFEADSIVGIGGGSVLDTAKLLAAMIDNEQGLSEIVGNGLLNKRKVYLACLPTTSGTGSEVSPNAIFFDTVNNDKKGVISSSLVPDATYVDPMLTVALPPAITAYTALDALTHCLEAYVNNFSHPMCDLLALEGIRLISGSLLDAVKNGDDINARTNLALGSVYGGMCLGPVNTAAVHALAYPLGSKYKIPHGLANAILLPHVMEFNLSAAPRKYAKVAQALGVDNLGDDELMAKEGINVIKELIRQCSIPSKLSELNIEKDAIEDMAHSALKVQRLLKNNVKEVTLLNAIYIYMNAY